MQQGNPFLDSTIAAKVQDSDEYAAALFILTAPLYAALDLSAFVTEDGIDFLGVLEGWPLSAGERIGVTVAMNLFKSGGAIDLTDLTCSLDDAMYHRVIEAMHIRRGHLRWTPTATTIWTERPTPKPETTVQRRLRELRESRDQLPDVAHALAYDQSVG